MFKDYYQLLGISSSSSKQEVKQAYRSKSLKWHPDRNPGVDVTDMMQNINEAYTILKDDTSRARYDKEYEKFRQTYERSMPKSGSPKYETWSYDYEVNDDDLKNDINEARKYAKDLVDEFFKNIKKTSKVAAKGAWDDAYGYIIGAVLISIIFALIRTCH